MAEVYVIVKRVDARGSHYFEGLHLAVDRWPLVLMDFPERRIADSSLHQAFGLFEELLASAQRAAERVYVITDLTRMTELAPASQRKYASDWLERTMALQRAVTLGVANVTPSVIVRGLVTALSWFKDAPVPTVWVATRREAYGAAASAFERAGTRLRPELGMWLAAEGSRRP
jgi:RecJ-like exonuclease